MKSITLLGSKFTPNGDTKFGIPEYSDGSTRVLINDKLEIMTRGGSLTPIAEVQYSEIWGSNDVADKRATAEEIKAVTDKGKLPVNMALISSHIVTGKQIGRAHV